MPPTGREFFIFRSSNCVNLCRDVLGSFPIRSRCNNTLYTSRKMFFAIHLEFLSISFRWHLIKGDGDIFWVKNAAPPTQVTTTIEADGRGDDDDDDVVVVVVVVVHETKGSLKSLNIKVFLRNLRGWWSESLITLTRSDISRWRENRSSKTRSTMLTTC